MTLKVSTSTSCTSCDEWDCYGFISPSDEYQKCIANSSLWTNAFECTFCKLCTTTSTIKRCSCDSQSNCSENRQYPSSTWWILAISFGGLIFSTFVICILWYILKMMKAEHQSLKKNNQRIEGLHRANINVEEYRS